MELAAIAVAAEEHAGVSVGAVRAALDALAATLRDRVGAREGAARTRALVRAFYRDLAFFAPDDYGDPELNRIDRVLERRAGSPVALAVTLIALARRAGVELEPVAFPGHFLVRASEPRVLIEPCTGAMPIPEAALREIAERELGSCSIDALLARAHARSVAARLMQNLQQVSRDRGDRSRALALEERLLALGGPEASARRAVASLIRGLQGERARAPSRRLSVHPRGLSFHVDDGPPVDLRRRRALPLILVRLVEHHRAGATHGLGWPALIEAGWPGEKSQADAAWARLRTAVRTLRRLGLADVLITIGSGYLLDPSWDVRWDA